VRSCRATFAAGNKLSVQVAREMRASARDVSIICREFGKPIKSSFNGSRCLLTLQPS
jgi:hypothetical protein